MDRLKRRRPLWLHSPVSITALLLVLLALAPFGGSTSRAEKSNSEPISATEFEELVGPIALYPDELMGIVLPASTYPLQIVQASRYLEKRKSDSSLKPDENWDPSVLGLLNYPEVITKLNDDLDWTWKLGEAVVNQQNDVMDAIQKFRKKVYDIGNLESNDKAVVIQKKEVIRIESTSPEVIYVPTYHPSTVVVYQSSPYPYVYSAPYPYYYNPAATFWTGMFVGAAIGYGLSWHGHGYGHSHITVNRNVNVNRNANINKNSNAVNRNKNVARSGDNAWKPNRNRGNQVGRPGQPPGGSAKPGKHSGQRPSNRPGDHSGGRPGTRPTGGKRDSATRPSQARNYQNQGGSFGGYKRGQDSHRNSQRGQRSRVSTSRYRNSGRTGGRSGFSGGGGRHRGGGGRRR